jgi:hypothetical protein
VTGSYSVFSDDAAYVTAKESAAADGDVYYNSTSDVVRVYTDGAWQNQINETTAQTVENKTLSDNTKYDFANVTIASNTFAKPSSSVARITSGTGPLNTITGASDGTILIVENKTGAALILANENAANGFTTGTGDDLEIADDASVTLIFNTSDTYWSVIGGSGSGGGLKLVVVTSTPFSAVKGEHYLVMSETVGSDVVCNAPAVADKAQFAISDGEKSFGTYKVTVNPNGSDTVNEATSYVMQDDRAAATFNADLANTNWVVDSNVIAGNGAIVSETSTRETLGLSDTTNVSTRQITWSRSADKMRCDFIFKMSGIGASVDITLTIPNSETINTDKISSTSIGESNLGTFRWLDGTLQKDGFLSYESTTSVNLFVTSGTASDRLEFDQLDNGDAVSGYFEVPIVGWEDGTTNLNADAITKTKTIDLDVSVYSETPSTSFTINSARGKCEADSEGNWWVEGYIDGAETTTVSKSWCYMTVAGITVAIDNIGIAVGDVNVVNRSSDQWFSCYSDSGTVGQIQLRSASLMDWKTNTVSIGLSFRLPLTGKPTDAFVGADSNFATFTECLEKNPAVGVEHATSEREGLVGGSNGVENNGTDTYVGGNGQIGEVIRASNTTATAPSSNTWGNLESIALDKGSWLVTASLGLQTSSSWSRIIGAISLNDSVDYDSFNYRIFDDAPNGVIWNHSLPPRYLSVDAPATVYLNVNVTYSGTLSIYQVASLEAIRIA